MAGARVSRELSEMLDQLDRQLTLLDEFCHKAFDERRLEYLPEIASKLRILTVRSLQNVPLLFRVAEALGQTMTITLNGPPLIAPPGQPTGGDTITLDQFFDLEAVTIATSQGPITMTKRQLIRAWCEQLGGVHEDWKVDEALLNAIRSPVYVGGFPIAAVELRNSARDVISHGRRLLALAPSADTSSARLTRRTDGTWTSSGGRGTSAEKQGPPQPENGSR